MPSLRQITQERGPISVFSPVRRVPMEPPRRGRAPQRPIARSNSRLSLSLARRAQRLAEEEDTEGFWGDFGRGLGFLVNNPISQVALKPLEALDYPRRASILGTEMYQRALPDVARQTGLGGVTGVLFDEEASRADERSVMDRLRDPTYGYGDIVRDLDWDVNLSPGMRAALGPVGSAVAEDPQWTNRAIGLAGDLALDPLSYLTFGQGGVAGKSARANNLAKLLQAQRQVQPTVNQAKAFRALGFADDAIPAPLRQAEEYAARLGGEAALERLGSRGLNTANAAQLAAMGMEAPGVRLFIPFTRASSGPIRGTAPIARGVNEALGAARPLARRLPGAERLRHARSPLGQGLEQMRVDLHPAYERILGEQSNVPSISTALDAITLDDLTRQATGTFDTLAADQLNRAAAEWDQLDDVTVQQMLREAEEEGVENTFTNFAKRMRQTAQAVGADIPELSGQQYAIPHVLHRDFRNALLAGHHANNPRAAAFMERSGIRVQDLLEESGFLQKRKFRAGKKYQFGDKTVTIEKGSIDELNRKLGDLFPEYQGPIYETNPILAYHRYIQGVGQDVGRRWAVREAARSGMPNVRELGDTGQLVFPDSFDPYGGRVPITGVEGQELQRVARAEGAAPEDEFFRYVDDPEATKARNAAILESQPAILRQYEDAGLGERAAIAQELEDIADMVRGPQLVARQTAKESYQEAGRRGKRLYESMEDAVADYSALLDDMAEMDNEIRRLGKVRYGLERTARNRAARRQKELLDDLWDRQQALMGEREAARRNHDALIKFFEEKTEQKFLDNLDDEGRRLWDTFIERQREYNEAVERAKEAYNGPIPSDKEIRDARSFLTRNQAAYRKYDDFNRERLRLMREQEVLEKQKWAEPEVRVRKDGSTYTKWNVGTEDRPGYPQFKKTARQKRIDFINRQLQTDEKMLRVKRATDVVREDRMFRDFLEGRAPFERLPNQPQNISTGAAEAQRIQMVEAWRDWEQFSRAERTSDMPDLVAQQRAMKERFEKEQIDQLMASEAESVQIAQRMEDIAAGRDPEYQRVATREQSRNLSDRRAAQAEIDRIRYQKGVTAATMAEVDMNHGAYQTQYYRAREDFTLAREQHDQIAQALRDNRIRPIDSRSPSPPSQADVRRVAAGDIPPAEAQPLYSVVEDIRKLAAANPAGEDDLLVRAEAALAPVEAQLAGLTESIDIPADQVNRIIREAKSGRLGQVMMAKLRDNWVQVWEGGDVVIGNELARTMRNLEPVIKEPNWLGKLLTTYTNFFKTYATATPGFHVRNAMSAIFMNYADGVGSRAQQRGVELWRQYAKAEDPLQWLVSRPPDERAAFQAVFGSGAGGRFFEAGIADATQFDQRWKQRVFSNPWTQTSQRIGQDWVEGPVRLGMAIDTIDNGGNVRDALNRISRIHFDYGQVSKFDERAKRLIPFWTFMSRNLPMQITMMWSKPRLYNQYNSFIRNFSGEEEPFTPEYFDKIGAFRFADTEVAGLPLFLQPDFAHTRLDEDLQKIEDVLSAEDLPRLFSDFNPMFTAPAEYALDRNFFTGRTYDEGDLRATGGLESPLGWIAEALRLGQRTPSGEFMAEEKFLDAMRSMIPVYDRSVRLAPQVATGGNEPDAEARQLESFARFLGLPIRQLSEQQQQSQARSNYYDQLDALRLQQQLARLDAMNQQ